MDFLLGDPQAGKGTRPFQTLLLLFHDPLVGAEEQKVCSHTQLCNSNNCQRFSHPPSPSAICRAVMLTAWASAWSEAGSPVSATGIAY